LLQKLDQIGRRTPSCRQHCRGGTLDSQKFVAASKEYADLGRSSRRSNEWRKAERS
jgi:peptide chain release factor 1